MTSRPTTSVARARRWAVATTLALAASAVVAPPHSRATADHDDDVMQGLDCDACHTTARWALSDTAGAEGGFDHARTGFPLTGAHRPQACTACHRPNTRVSRDCASCHADQHRRKLGLQCDSCHNARSWQHTRASRRHRLTRLPLTGMHAVLDCTSCHVRRSDRQYQPVPAGCFACHEADYRGDIHPNHLGDPAAGLAPFSRDCSKCHQPLGWSPAFVNLAAQRPLTAAPPATHDRVFVLSRGPHRGARCATCHASSADPRAVRCSGCHAHAPPSLRATHRRFVSSSAAACLTCHPRGVAR